MSSARNLRGSGRKNISESSDKKTSGAQSGEKKSEKITEKPAETETNEIEQPENFEEKYNALNDRFLRLAADFDNFRKRADKEKQQAKFAGIREIAPSIFATLDSLEIALRHGSQPSFDSEGLISGIRLTYERCVSQLKNFGIKQLSAEVGEKFNPALHQAIENTPSREVEKGMIAREIAKGYSAEDILLRPVAVAVSSGPEEFSAADSAAQKKEKQQNG